MSDQRLKIDACFHYVKERLYSEKTKLIYDHIVNGREHEFPSAEEIARIYPNPCGYSTGMEDGMINGGTMLDACLIRYEKQSDECAGFFAKNILEGQLLCAFAARSEGFLPRAVSPNCERSYYPDSSRDQYTMFAFGAHKYLNSALCSSEERERIAHVAVAIARRAEKNVTRATGYDMLTDDGRPTLVNVMWGDTLGNHEWIRLPMLYLLAYESSGDPHWLDQYRKTRETAYEKSLPMGRYWHLYALGQMQASLRVCLDADHDAGWSERYLSLMHKVADYAEDMCDEIRQKIESFDQYNAKQVSFRELEMPLNASFQRLGYESPLLPSRPDAKEFFTLQDAAQIAIISGLVPNRGTKKQTLKLLDDAFEKIDLSIHERNLPVFFLQAYYRNM